MTGWLPIESAPRTPHAILVWCPANLCIFAVTWEVDEAVGYWAVFGAGYGRHLVEEPTFWMPLPDPPSEQPA